MANIAESRTARLARERLEAIKKFLLVRDSVRQKLHARQEAKVEFTEGAEELFKPVTSATETVKTAIIGKPDPTDPDKPQKSLLQAIEQLTVAQPKPAKPTAAEKPDFISKFTEGIEKIKEFQLLKPNDIAEFGAFASDSYNSRSKFLNPWQDKYVSKKEWLDWVYKINRGIGRVNTREITYQIYQEGVTSV